MTPANIAGMAAVLGLDVIALTDHNTSRNCAPFLKMAEAYGLLALPGMELTTDEDVHVVCLFPDLYAAMDFDAYVHDRLPKIENRAEIFGEQRILNEQDEIIGYEPYLLINATTISIEEVADLVRRFGGVCWPAHIDKSSTSVFSNLGYFSPDWGFSVVEIADRSRIGEFAPKIPGFENMLVLTNSDAHYLWNISEGENFLSTDDFLAELGLK